MQPLVLISEFIKLCGHAFLSHNLIVRIVCSGWMDAKLPAALRQPCTAVYTWRRVNCSAFFGQWRSSLRKTLDQTI